MLYPGAMMEPYGFIVGGAAVGDGVPPALQALGIDAATVSPARLPAI